VRCANLAGSLPAVLQRGPNACMPMLGCCPCASVLQAVYELYNITQGTEWRPDEPQTSKVVVIGRNLKKDILQEWFNATKA
jgi:G3E family GTPase